MEGGPPLSRSLQLTIDQFLYHFLFLAVGDALVCFAELRFMEQVKSAMLVHASTKTAPQLLTYLQINTWLRNFLHLHTVYTRL